jgi:predicted amidohydrolase YtcJ
MTIDGGYTGPAAWTIEPYRDRPDYFGVRSISAEDLYVLSKAAHEMGWQMGVHTIGNAAIEMTVDVWERMLNESPRADHRHYLNHFTVMPPAATMRKMADHNILIAQQPNFTYTLEGRYRANLVGERLQGNNAVRTPMDYGIFMAFGSDVLPIGPMVGLYAAVTRKGMDGLVYGKEERVSVAEAIVAYTRNGAYLTFEEDIKGTLEPGKLADLIVLSDDLLTIRPEEILDVQVDLTVVDGRIVYERPLAAARR